MTRQEWYNRGRDPEKRKQSYLRHSLLRVLRKFGFSLEEYQAIVDLQGGVCAICLGPPVGKTRLSLDHNHITGRFRGLLCDYCNVGLARFQDCPKVLQAAIDYLESRS